MSLYYDESRPSLLQIKYHEAAKKRRLNWRAIGVKDHGIDLRNPYRYRAPPNIKENPPFWALDNFFSFSIPEIDANGNFKTIPHKSFGRYTVNEVQDAICKVAGITRTEILGPKRVARIVVPRQAAMALCRVLTKRSFPEIGRHFGGRDHSTICHASYKMEPLIEEISWMFEAQTLPAIANMAIKICVRDFQLPKLA